LGQDDLQPVPPNPAGGVPFALVVLAPTRVVVGRPEQAPDQVDHGVGVRAEDDVLAVGRPGSQLESEVAHRHGLRRRGGDGGRGGRGGGGGRGGRGGGAGGGGGGRLGGRGLGARRGGGRGGHRGGGPGVDVVAVVAGEQQDERQDEDDGRDGGG